MRPAIPSRDEAVALLTSDPVNLSEWVCRAFVVGSIARGTPRAGSDLDILVEVVPPDSGEPEADLESYYRERLHSVPVEMRPSFRGRPVDFYLTYDADADNRAKVELV